MKIVMEMILVECCMSGLCDARWTCVMSRRRAEGEERDDHIRYDVCEACEEDMMMIMRRSSLFSS